MDCTSYVTRGSLPVNQDRHNKRVKPNLGLWPFCPISRYRQLDRYDDHIGSLILTRAQPCSLSAFSPDTFGLVNLFTSTFGFGPQTYIPTSMSRVFPEQINLPAMNAFSNVNIYIILLER